MPFRIKSLINDQILISVLPDDQQIDTVSKVGLALGKESRRERLQVARVIQVGPGDSSYDANGILYRQAMNVAPGDLVLVDPESYRALDLTNDGDPQFVVEQIAVRLILSVS